MTTSGPPRPRSAISASRGWPDLVVVAPASANLLAKMAHGLADDLATTVLLATRAPVLVAPAMNPAMWEHPATRANMALLRSARRVHRRARRRARWPSRKAARAAWPSQPRSMAAIRALLAAAAPLAGRHAIVTTGPTHEPIDPVRYIANRSSGKQGHAIAGGAGSAGRARHAGQRPGCSARPAGRRGAPRGDGARDAGRLRGRAARRHRGLGRRRRRLARGAGGDAEAEEGGRARRRPRSPWR